MRRFSTFIKGYPSVMTLRVGEVGLQAIVDGKYATSFAFRKRFEPWLINKVQIFGEFELISALATGLPTSEDVDNIIDLDHKSQMVNEELWDVVHTYEDIQLMHFTDYYDLITLKTLATCIFGTQVASAKYVMKTFLYNSTFYTKWRWQPKNCNLARGCARMSCDSYGTLLQLYPLVNNDGCAQKIWASTKS